MPSFCYVITEHLFTYIILKYEFILFFIYLKTEIIILFCILRHSSKKSVNTGVARGYGVKSNTKNFVFMDAKAP
jgi:hypothetical protein